MALSYSVRGWVEDDGAGIKPEDLKHLFQPFVRGDSARSTSGTGLGLAIVQRIIDAHAGSLDIGTSERGVTDPGVYSVAVRYEGEATCGSVSFILVI